MKGIKDLNWNDIEINSCSWEQYELIIHNKEKGLNNISLWVASPEDNAEIVTILEEMGVGCDFNEDEFETQTEYIDYYAQEYHSHEDEFDWYWIKNVIGLENIKELLEEKLKEEREEE